MWFPWQTGVNVERPMGEVELASKLAALTGDIESIEIAKEGKEEIFTDLAGVDGILDFLRDTMVNDIKRYFAAQNDHERDLIRGAFSRTAYLRSQVLLVDK